MKRKLLLILSSLLALVCSLWGIGCNQTADVSIQPNAVSVFFVYDDEERLQAAVITVKDAELEEGTVLLHVMESLKDERTFSYTLSNGMLTEINGVKNGANYNPCWMLYTSDAEFSNAEYGTYTYNGQALGSAILGAESLPVQSGGVYIWVHQSF